MAIGVPYYVQQPRAGAAFTDWTEQGMVQPMRPAVAVPVEPSGMNPYQLGPIEDAPPAPALDYTPAPPMHVAHPGMFAESYGPSPAVPTETAGGGEYNWNPFGGSVPVPASPAAQAPPDRPPGGMRFNPRDVALALGGAGPPPSRRYSSTRPEFIFTNPAAAQQAAANYQARLGYEQAQDQGYRQYQGQLAAEQAATERANAATEAARANEQTRLNAIQQEGAAGRASNEKIAGMSEAVRQYRQAEADWQANEQAANLGESDADTINKNPDLLAKVGTRFIKLNPQTGKWESKFKRQTRPTPPSFLPQAPQPAVPTETGPVAGAGPAVPSAPTAGQAVATPTAPTGEAPPYNFAAGWNLPTSGAMAYAPPVLAARALKAVWPYTPTGWVVNRIAGAFQ